VIAPAIFYKTVGLRTMAISIIFHDPFECYFGFGSGFFWSWAWYFIVALHWSFFVRLWAWLLVFFGKVQT